MKYEGRNDEVEPLVRFFFILHNSSFILAPPPRRHQTGGAGLSDRPFQSKGSKRFFALGSSSER